MTPSEIKSLYREKLNNLRSIAKNTDILFPEKNTLELLLEKNFFDIAFIGEFTSGKSTIINALLGEDVLPTKLGPTTAKITYIIYSTTPYVLLYLNDNSKKELPYSANVLKNLIATNYEEINQIKYIELYYPAEFLKDGIRLIDTPGSNDTNKQRVEVTYNLLPSVDAVIYTTISPLTLSNLNFFKEYIIGSGIKNVFYLLNKIDLFNNNEANISKAIDGVKNVIQQEVKNEIKLFAVSALDYLDGRINKEDDLIRSSNFTQFIKEISDFLTSSNKYNNTLAQLDFHYENMKIEQIELLKLKLSGLLMPEDVFTEKNNTLWQELDKYRRITQEVKRDIDIEYYRLVNKLNDSLNNLNEDMKNSIEIGLSQVGTDVKLKQQNMEFILKKQFENWISWNEPIIEKYFNTLKMEIQERLHHIIENISISLKSFNTNITTIKSEEKATGSLIQDILSDETKSKTALALGSAAIYSTIAILHLAIAPLALLISPVGMYLLQKKKAEEIKVMKKQFLTEFENKSKKFNQEIIEQIDRKKNELIEFVDELVNNFTNNVINQIEIIKKERTVLKEELEVKTKIIKEAINSLNGNFK